MSNHPDAAWTPLDAASKALGISPDATRKRIERGTLAGEKRGGRWFVALDSLDASPNTSDTPPSGLPDATWTPPDASSDSLRELVDHLKEENVFLRSQLEQRSHELADERERSDVLHREAFARIEALTAGPSSMLDSDQAPASMQESPESPYVAQDGSGAMGAESLNNESSSGGPDGPHGGFARWWARIFGR